MTPHERLRAARQAASEGRHDDALREFIWFHEHALDEDLALYGVRLSFALGAWIDLGHVYQPARQALDDVRERNARALLDGAADWHLFHDVVAIDELRNMPAATRALYLALEERQPAFARRVVDLALPPIVRSGDHALAHRIRPAPEAAIRAEAAQLRANLRMVRRMPLHPVPLRWHFIDGYARFVRLQAEITAAVAGPAQARQLAALATGVIPDRLLRAAVSDQIARPSEARVWRKRRHGWSGPRRAD